MINQDAGPAILFFGNLPPPYGGLPSHLAFLTPRLFEYGYAPIVLVRQVDDYSEWLDLGVHVRNLPHDDRMMTDEIDAFRTRISTREAEICDEMFEAMRWVAEPERFMADLAFADRIVREHSVQLIHTYHLYGRSAVALTLKTLHDLPAFLTIFGEVVSKYAKTAVVKPSAYWMLRQFDMLLATSRHCASGAELIGISSDQIRVIPYGVDFNFFRKVDSSSVIDKYGLQDRDIILFQGRISPEKGPQVLIEALPKIVSERPQVVALFVGPDEAPGFGPTGLTDTLKSRVAELGLTEHVRFVGAVPFEELPYYYSSAHVLAFPSTTQLECMGLAIKQAMACHLPVVAAMAGGACEAVDDGITGYCCLPGDEESLADNLLRVLVSPNRKELGKAGYERGLRLFTQERTLNDIDALYRHSMGLDEMSFTRGGKN